MSFGDEMITAKPTQDPYQVKDMVQSEIMNRFGALAGGLSSQIDWAVNTKHLNSDDVSTLYEMRKTLLSMTEVFNERTIQDMAEGPVDLPGLAYRAKHNQPCARCSKMIWRGDLTQKVDIITPLG